VDVDVDVADLMAVVVVAEVVVVDEAAAMTQTMAGSTVWTATMPTVNSLYLITTGLELLERRSYMKFARRAVTVR